MKILGILIILFPLLCLTGIIIYKTWSMYGVLMVGSAVLFAIFLILCTSCGLYLIERYK